MSEADDALREMARNRGCRLVKSRRRKPGGDFGLYGLKDARTGKEVLGFGDDGFTATAEQVEQYLRGGAAARWKSSLAADGEKAPRGDRPPRPRKARRPHARDEAAPGPPAPEAAPDPVIRAARAKDGKAVAALVRAVEFEIDAVAIGRSIARLAKAGMPVLVADQDGIVGLLAWQVTDTIHRPLPLGRVTLLAVATDHRGKGIGSALLEAAERRMRDLGCGAIEVTSNVKRSRAHAFYERHGFARTSFRFARSLTG